MNYDDSDRFEWLCQTCGQRFDYARMPELLETSHCGEESNPFTTKTCDGDSYRKVAKEIPRGG